MSFGPYFAILLTIGYLSYIDRHKDGVRTFFDRLPNELSRSGVVSLNVELKKVVCKDVLGLGSLL